MELRIKTLLHEYYQYKMKTKQYDKEKKLIKSMSIWIEEQVAEARKNRTLVSDEERDQIEKALTNKFTDASKELVHKAMKIVNKM